VVVDCLANVAASAPTKTRFIGFLVELKSELHAGQPRTEIGQTIKKIEALLSPDAPSPVYAGYPYDPYKGPGPNAKEIAEEQS
jgi:hypothetical protein